MNHLEKKAVDLLLDLKENHHITSVKAEFETEGATFEEVIRLKELALRANLNLTIKIGGCEALKDLHEAKIIGADKIVAPMVESPYAVKKFTNIIEKIFSLEELKDTDFLINIETPLGVENLDNILSASYSDLISGVIFGRNDMSKALNLQSEDTDNEILFEYAQTIAEKTKNYNKTFTIGGGVCIKSLDFFKNLKPDLLDNFETRKIIFDAKRTLLSNTPEKALLKALEFEILWTKNKRDSYKMFFEENSQRIKTLEERYRKFKTTVDFSSF